MFRADHTSRSGGRADGDALRRDRLRRTRLADLPWHPGSASRDWGPPTAGRCPRRPAWCAVAGPCPRTRRLRRGRIGVADPPAPWRGRGDRSRPRWPPGRSGPAGSRMSRTDLGRAGPALASDRRTRTRPRGSSDSTSAIGARGVPAASAEPGPVVDLSPANRTGGHRLAIARFTPARRPR